MEPSELFGITTYINLLYQERFPLLSDAMAKIWFEEVQHLDEDLLSQAVRRWARHHTLKAPTLDELLEQVEFVRDEQARTRRAGSSDKSFLDVLRDAALAQAANPERSDDDGTFGHLMATIGERSVSSWVDEQGVVREKLTLEQRATQCYEWANKYQAKSPGMAEDLRHTARTYARIYHDQQEGTA